MSELRASSGRRKHTFQPPRTKPQSRAKSRALILNGFTEGGKQRGRNSKASASSPTPEPIAGAVRRLFFVSGVPA
eukprot:502605-Prorocentrum_minimum.AAC.2